MTSNCENLIGRIVYLIRRVIYKMGGRPKRGSIWYSPSWETHYTMKNAYIGLLQALTTRMATEARSNE